jgi:hypothetical protein
VTTTPGSDGGKSTNQATKTDGGKSTVVSAESLRSAIMSGEPELIQELLDHATADMCMSLAPDAESYRSHAPMYPSLTELERKHGIYDTTPASSTIDGATLSVFHLAVFQGISGGVVSRMLDIGGEKLLESKDREGRTALEIATSKKHKTIVEEINKWTAQQAAWEGKDARKNAGIVSVPNNFNSPGGGLNNIALYGSTLQMW